MSVIYCTSYAICMSLPRLVFSPVLITGVIYRTPGVCFSIDRTRDTFELFDLDRRSRPLEMFHYLTCSHVYCVEKSVVIDKINLFD